MVRTVTRMRIKCDVHRSRFSSRTTSSSDALSAWAQRSILTNRVCNSGVQDSFHFSTTMTLVCGRANRGCRNVTWEQNVKEAMMEDMHGKSGKDICKSGVIMSWTRSSGNNKLRLGEAHIFLHPLVDLEKGRNEAARRSACRSRSYRTSDIYFTVLV